jgi:hypothetical protein
MLFQSRRDETFGKANKAGLFDVSGFRCKIQRLMHAETAVNHGGLTGPPDLSRALNASGVSRRASSSVYRSSGSLRTPSSSFPRTVGKAVAVGTKFSADMIALKQPRLRWLFVKLLNDAFPRDMDEFTPSLSIRGQTPCTAESLVDFEDASRKTTGQSRHEATLHQCTHLM